MSDDFTLAERKALDGFSVPAPSTGFVSGILAAASTQTQAQPPVQTWPRPVRRTPWVRRGVFSAVTALTLATAAAASGWLGERIVNLPVISSIATIVPEAVKAKPAPKPKVEAPKIVKAEPKAPAIVVKPAPVAIVVPPPAQASEATQINDIDMAPVRQEARAERITSRAERRLDARDTRRVARGLPADSDAQRAILTRVKTASTVEERRAALREWRQAKAERLVAINARRAERGLAPIVPRQGAEAGSVRPARLERCKRLAERGFIPPMCRNLEAAPDASEPPVTQLPQR